MYSKQDLKEKLEKNNKFLDIKTLGEYLRNWRVDPVYEDENGIEYYDESAIIKLNQGVLLREDGNSDEDIISIINGNIKKSSFTPAVKKMRIQSQQEAGELKNITVDITNQTLTLLADTIVQKISDEIVDKIRTDSNSGFDIGKLQRDNEILAAQIDGLIDENRSLVEKINLLVQEQAKYKPVFGSFYLKL